MSNPMTKAISIKYSCFQLYKPQNLFLWLFKYNDFWAQIKNLPHYAYSELVAIRL